MNTVFIPLPPPKESLLSHHQPTYPTLHNPHHPYRVVARLSREFIPNISDPWKVRVYQGQEVDYRLIQIFAAFALDSASTFLKDQ